MEHLSHIAAQQLGPSENGKKIPFGCRNSAPLGRLMREPVEYKSGSCYANSRAQLDWGVVVPQGLLLQHSQFQSLCYPFSWENNHKNHHIFPRVISQPGNVEWNNSPADPGGFGVTPNPPPPPKTCILRGRIVGPTRGKALKEPNAWSVAGSSTLRPELGSIGIEKNSYPIFFGSG